MRAELSPYAVDPFGPSANPSAYVACEASERARGILEQSLDEGRVAALIGPPGHGKTLLLHLIGGREQERARVAYVPFCTLEFDELCTVVLNAIGASRPGPPREVLVAVTRELAATGGVVVLVDDAHAMSEACATALAALYAELDGALRIALAAVQSPTAQRVFRAFGTKIDVVMLAGGMTGRESRRYVEMRLAYGGVRPEIVEQFDEATIDALHRASQGVPRRLNQAAENIVRRATRAELPRLRQLTAPAAPPPVVTESPPPTDTSRDARERSAPRAVPPVPARAPEAPAPVREVPVRATRPRVEPLPPPAARAREPEPELPAPAARPREESARPTPAHPRRRAPRAPAQPAAPRPPIGRAPSPPSPPPEDDDRGILLPEIFHREAGEPAGEYRIVRGTPLPAPPPRAAGPATPRREAPRSVLVVRGDEPPRTREIPMPSAYADRVPQPRPPASLPIRAIGIAGFVLGVAVSMAWILGSEPQPPHILPMKPPPAAAHPPAPDARAARPAAPRAPAAPRRAPVPKPEPAPERAAPQPALAPPPAPAPAEPAAPARVLVSINATPWAIVRIDGREVGETPLAGIALEPGSHVFQARMPDGTTREQTVEVSASRRTVVFQ